MNDNREETRYRAVVPRRWLIGAVTVVILGLAIILTHHWQGGGFSAADGVPLLKPSPLTIAPGIHLLGGLEPAAAYVVETSDGLVLIDTGLDKEAAALRRQMKALKLDWMGIRAILLTHVHGDHSGGAQYLRTATGAKVYAGQGDAAILRAGQSYEAFFGTFHVPEYVKPNPTTVDVELSDEQGITVGDVHFLALATPGHTPGSVCFLMERGEQRVLFAGDVIMSLAGDEQSNSPFSRALGTYAAYLAPRYRGNVDAFLSTLRRLRALPAPQLVLPGHPRNDRVPQSPAMSQQRWEMLLDTGIYEMERLRGRYAEDGANFLDGIPKRLLPDLYYLGDFKDVAVYGFSVASKFFLVNAPGETGLGEFVNARLRQLGLDPVTPTAILLTSGDPEVTAGVADLVRKHSTLVVAPASVCEQIKNTCPSGTGVLTLEELPRKNWFRVKPVPLGGRGVAPVAYVVSWADKSVLFTGRIPIKPSHEAAADLAMDLGRGRGNKNEYRASLRRLGDLQPNLWLPAVPCEGQNANLYDGEWQDILTENAAVFR